MQEGMDEQFLGIFRDEAEEHIEQLNLGLLALENNPGDPEIIRDIARSAHTLKGSSKLMGFDDINVVAHQMEDLLIAARDEGRHLGRADLNLLFEGLDVISTLVEAAVAGETTDIEIDALCRRLEQALHTEASEDVLAEAAIPSSAEASVKSDTLPGEETDTASEPMEDISGLLSPAKEALEELNEQLLKLEMEEEKGPVLNQAISIVQSFREHAQGIESQLTSLHISGTLLRVETIFQIANQEKIEITEQVLDLVFQGLGLIEMAINVTEDGEESDWNPDDFYQLVDETVPELAGYLAESDSSVSVEEGGQTPLESSVETERHADDASVEQDDEVDAPVPQQRELSLEDVPDAELSLPEETISDLPTERRTADLQTRKEQELKQVGTQSELAKPGQSGQSQLEETIRVGISKLDQLTSICNEMIVSRITAQNHGATLEILSKEANLATYRNDMRTILSNLNTQFDSFAYSLQNGSDGLAIQKNSGILKKNLETLNELVETFSEENSQLERTLSEFTLEYTESVASHSLIVDLLQDTVQATRVLPVASLFNSFKRPIRDLAQEFDKEIQLEIDDQDTNLDKTIVDDLRAPFMHLIRNSVDHGVELPDDREKLGKPRQGTITLSAEQTGDLVYISIKDDGAGIDPEKLRNVALQKGVIDQTESEAMSDQDIPYLVLEAGFSTKEVVTDTSGRGVGMDVVQKEISNLRGEIKIKTQVNIGTEFRLKLPLTLANQQLCMVRVEESHFAFPTTSIDTTELIKPEDIMSVANKPAIVIQDKTNNEKQNIIPMVYLHDVLEMNGSTSQRSQEETPVVVLTHNNRLIAFAVDQFVGVSVMVMNSLNRHLGTVRNVAGHSIMGNGEVAFVLSVPDLMDNAKIGAVRRDILSPKDTLPVFEQPAVKSVLVVEDSVMVRELERNILESAGYEVDVAVDGLEGVEKLEQKPYDLVVSDIQMPRMDGYEFISKFKSDERYKHIPAIIISTLAKEEEKRKGFEAGADRYIVKSAFDKDTLLTAVESLIGSN
jgi:chemotaxis protein histidine kinase CheA/ActR/RegA family two-component response regulator